MNVYQKEQLDALLQVRDKIKRLGTSDKNDLMDLIQPYLDFRRKLEVFLDKHLARFCTQACFESQASACCSKDGIITFWADVVINACCAEQKELDRLESAIRSPMFPNKCIYLETGGCLWHIRPLVCAMFVCEAMEIDVIHKEDELKTTWDSYRHQAKGFRWPDQPVLFDQLETMFMEMGCNSPLMYINTSPALMRIKKQSEGR